MTSNSSGLDALAQRKTLLLRLNDEIDADTHATISDAERYLRDGPGSVTGHNSIGVSHIHPQAELPVASVRAHGTAGGVSGNPRGVLSTATRSNSSKHQNDQASLGSSRRAAAGAGLESSTMGRREQVAEFAAVARVNEGGRGSSGIESGLTRRVRANSDAAVSSLMLALSERERASAKGPGERNSRRRAGSVFSADTGDNDRAVNQGQGPPERGANTGRVTPESRAMNRPTNGKAVGSGWDEEERVEDEADVPPGIGEEATARYYKAKLAACQSQLQDALQTSQARQRESVELRRTSASEQEHVRRVSRQLQQLQQAKDKDSKAKEEEAANAAALAARVGELERELAASRRVNRQAETDKKSLEVRLHRALQEASKQKEAARQTREDSKDLGQGQRWEVSKLEGQCQRLERQKMELLSAFKKQLKLIDILKRQKFHAEASRVLGFTEEDFVKTLDWDASNARD